MDTLKPGSLCYAVNHILLWCEPHIIQRTDILYFIEKENGCRKFLTAKGEIIRLNESTEVKKA